jgi:hypothetical protein
MSLNDSNLPLEMRSNGRWDPISVALNDQSGRNISAAVRNQDKPFKLNPKYESNLITISCAARPVEQIIWMGRVLG